MVCILIYGLLILSLSFYSGKRYIDFKSISSIEFHKHQIFTNEIKLSCLALWSLSLKVNQNKVVLFLQPDYRSEGLITFSFQTQMKKASIHEDIQHDTSPFQLKTKLKWGIISCLELRRVKDLKDPQFSLVTSGCSKRQ